MATKAGEFRIILSTKTRTGAHDSIPLLRVKRIYVALTPVFYVLWLFCSFSTLAFASHDTYRIGLTSVFLHDQTSALKLWQSYLERQLDAKVEFVQRDTYGEITDLLLGRHLDLAWICGLPYVRNNISLQLVVIPVFEGEPLYQSYLIVPNSDDKTSDISDLKEKVFAYSDPDSNSGYLVPQVAIASKGFNPKHFFRRTFFTWSHRDVIEAVAVGLAQGGAVDGYVWETLKTVDPALIKRTRVVMKSKKFGFPPMVTYLGIKTERFNKLQKAFLSMSSDPEGQLLLQRLNLDGFIVKDDRLYFDILAAANSIGKY
jgi:phosphonate transport system substrate-binding protein